MQCHHHTITQGMDKQKHSWMKKCFGTNKDIFMSLLQIRSTTIAPGLPSLAPLSFDIPTWWLLKKIQQTTSWLWQWQKYWWKINKQTTKNWKRYRCSHKYFSFIFSLNCGSTAWGWRMLDTWYTNWTRLRSIQQVKLWD